MSGWEMARRMAYLIGFAGGMALRVFLGILLAWLCLEIAKVL